MATQVRTDDVPFQSKLPRDPIPVVGVIPASVDEHQQGAPGLPQSR